MVQNSSSTEVPPITVNTLNPFLGDDSGQLSTTISKSGHIIQQITC